MLSVVTCDIYMTLVKMNITQNFINFPDFSGYSMIDETITCLVSITPCN